MSESRETVKTKIIFEPAEVPDHHGVCHSGTLPFAVTEVAPDHREVLLSKICKVVNKLCHLRHHKDYPCASYVVRQGICSHSATVIYENACLRDGRIVNEVLVAIGGLLHPAQHHAVFGSPR